MSPTCARNVDSGIETRMVSIGYGELMDDILKFMVEKGVPLTRENYLEIAYMGNPPIELDAEEEFDLPEQFQLNPPEEFE